MLASSTNDALEKLSQEQYSAIISDMGRREGPREGYVLLDRLKAQSDQTPFFFYASSNVPEHKPEAQEHGAQGCTNDATELFGMVTNAVLHLDYRRSTPMLRGREYGERDRRYLADVQDYENNEYQSTVRQFAALTQHHERKRGGDAS